MKNVRFLNPEFICLYVYNPYEALTMTVEYDLTKKFDAEHEYSIMGCLLLLEYHYLW